MFLVASAGALLLAFVLAGTATGAEKEGGDPGWYHRISPDREAVHAWEEGCRATFVLSWNGVIKAGRVEVEIEGADRARAGSRIVSAQARGRSAGLARLFWKYEFDYRSSIDLDSMRPVEILFEEAESRGETRTQVEFVKHKATCNRRVTKKDADEVEESKRIFKAPRIHDLTSAILYLRSQPLEQDDEISLVVYPFDTSYLVTFRVLGRENHPTALGKTPAIKMDLKIDKIDRKNQLHPYGKFKRAHIWISDDDFRLPLEIRTEIFVGNIRAVMTERRRTGEEGSAAASEAGN